MKKKRFTEQQIIGFLKEAEAGMPVKELCRKHGFSDAAFYGWRSKFGGLQVNELKRLREQMAKAVQPARVPASQKRVSASVAPPMALSHQLAQALQGTTKPPRQST